MTERILPRMAMVVLAGLLVGGLAFAGAAPEAEEGSAAGSTGPSTFQHAWDDPRDYINIAEYQRKTGKTIPSFDEAPMLKEMVAAGTIPKVEERLPEDPAVIVPYQEIGQYGGSAYIGRMAIKNWSDAQFVGISLEPMLRLSADMKTIRPNVATSYEVSADGKTYTWHLREGMKWSDGEPFGVDDMMFWYNDVIMNDELTPKKPKHWSPGGELVKFVKIDDTTLKMEFAVPYPALEANMAHTRGCDIMLPAHYLKQFHPNYTDEEQIMKKAKEEGYDNWFKLFVHLKDAWATQLPRYNKDMPTVLPFYITEYGSDVSVWERNPYYWKVDVAGNQLPYMDKIVVTQVENEEVWNGKVIAGEYTLSGFTTSIENYTLYKENEAQGDYKVIMWPTPLAAAVNYQPAQTTKNPVLRPIFRDVRFRRALSLAIDRDEINDAVFYGLAEPAQVTLLPSSKYYEERFAKAYIEYDPDRANALLDEMGLQWDRNREYRLMPDGNRLSFTIEYMPLETPKTAVTELVKEHWKDIGIEVTVKEGLWTIIWERVGSNEMDFSLCHAFGCNDLFFESGRMNWFVPMGTGWTDPWNTEWARWYLTDGDQGEEPPAEIKQLMDLLDEFMITVDENRKKEIARNILESQAENLWTIGTVRMNPQPLVVKNNLGNFPEKGLFGYDVVWTWPQHPEQFYLKQE